MKIIYLISSLNNSGGMERVVTVKSNLLSEKKNVNVEILTYSDDGKSFYDISNKVKLLNFSGTGVTQKNVFENIANYINTSSVNVVISTGGKDLAIMNKLNNSIYKILEVHFCFKNPVLREFSLNRNFLFRIIGYLKIIRNIYLARKCNLIVSLTSRDSELWKKYSRIPSLVIPNPSSFNVNENEIVKTRLKSHITRFIAVGRLNEQKDYNSLLLACLNLKKTLKVDNWVLEIYGDGELLMFLNNKIEEMELQDHVTIKKAVSNIKDIYLKSDFLLMTSVYEGLPMVLIEAMTFGIPCVSFNCESGPDEIINNDCNGYLVSSRSTDQFSKMMAKCVDMNEDKYKKFSVNAIINSRNYSQEMIIDKWHNIFIESKK